MTDGKSASTDDYIVIGNTNGVFGVQGWLKIFSWTADKANILEYNPVYLRVQDHWKPFRIAEGKVHGKKIIVRFEGVSDRDEAARMTGLDIAIRRSQLPELEADEYYWAELKGMQVVTGSGESLGEVREIMETGANDVLVVDGDRERLIPWIRPDVIREVDRDSRRIVVDWDPDF